jgi:hypothetical protein
LALSPEVLNALAKEHARLTAEHLRTSQEINEIAALLRRHGRQIETAPVRSFKSPSSAEANGGDADDEATSLRATILRVMAPATRGYRPSEMTNALVARGFEDTRAATPLGTRVASEMARLLREGRLAKDPDDGRYRAHAPNGRENGQYTVVDVLPSLRGQ